MTSHSVATGLHASAEDPSDAYREVREATVALCEPLSPEDCASQSMPDASPSKWHLAHTSWFFETFVLEDAAPGYRRFQDQYRVLFNSYYNGIGEQYARPQRGLLTRPSFAEVVAYREHIDRHVLDLLAKGPDCTPEIRTTVRLGLNHEQQHQELLLTDVKHLLSFNPLSPVYRDAVAPETEAAAPLRWPAYGGGPSWIGHGGSDFCFDNERPRHRVFLEPYELASRPASNADYLAFIEDGGYERPELWLSDGWTAVRERGWRAPLYWEERDGGWWSFTLHGLDPVQPEEPVCHVSYYEADAFARWSGARLPSEAEWECAATGAGIETGFVEEGRFHPAARPANGDPHGLPVGLFGDVWEWTQTPYGPYPGYAPPRGAVGEYNGKFMCNQLVLRGGSCATPRSHIRATYRNFFYPDARWQFSGIRIARDAH